MPAARAVGRRRSGGPACGSGATARTPLAAPGGGEDQLRAVLPAPVGDEVDRGARGGRRSATAPARRCRGRRATRRADRVAVQRLGPRPGARGAKHHPAVERQPQQIAEPGIRVGVRRDQLIRRRRAQPKGRTGRRPGPGNSEAPEGFTLVTGLSPNARTRGDSEGWGFESLRAR